MTRYERFWQMYRDYLHEKDSTLRLGKPADRTYMLEFVHQIEGLQYRAGFDEPTEDMPEGRIYYSFSISFDRKKDQHLHDPYYRVIRRHRSEIDAALERKALWIDDGEWGYKMETSRFARADTSCEGNWHEQIEWLAKQRGNFHRAFEPLIDRFAEEIDAELKHHPQ